MDKIVKGVLGNIGGQVLSQQIGRFLALISTAAFERD